MTVNDKGVEILDVEPQEFGPYALDQGLHTTYNQEDDDVEAMKEDCSTGLPHNDQWGYKEIYDYRNYPNLVERVGRSSLKKLLEEYRR